MKRKSIGLIIGLMLFGLLGVIAMQYFFIRQSYQLKAQLFDETVNAALNTVALKAEKKEALDFIQAQEDKDKRFKKLQEKRKVRWEAEQEAKQFVEGLRQKQRYQEAEFRDLEAKLLREFPSATLIDNGFFETYMKDPKLKSLVKVDIVSAPDGFYQRNRLDVYVNKPVKRPKIALDDSVRYLILDPYLGDIGVVALPPRKDTRLEREIARAEKEKFLSAGSFFESFFDLAASPASVIENLANDFELSKQPLKKRIDPYYIKQELGNELQNRGVLIPFNMEITAGERSDSILFKMASFSEADSEKGVYSTLLFPNSMVKSSGRLVVNFPYKDRMLFGNMGVMLGSSAMLLLVLIGCFAYTIMTILRQKKMSEMKTDFINNMTHEFKTPVATIMIASESLKDPDITADAKRVDRLASIIYDENVRLGNHIERVLNIARIDKGELRMESQDVDMNDLISAVIDSMDLQLKKRSAQLHFDASAHNAMVSGDELHLSNVIYNLIDNAIKYSKGAPEISVATKNISDQFIFTVSDRGIGMTREQQAKIFDQFYRVSTGNRHDVKGFGLGLSYVSDIIRRLKGAVKVRSEKDKGTQFEVSLPLKK